MFKLLIPAVAALGLVAFAAKTQPVVNDIAAAPTASGLGWYVTHEGETAKLAYGIANSDHVAMMVTCAPGDTSASVYGDVRPASAKVMARSDMQEASVPVRDATLRDLADKGSMTVVGDGGVFRINATAGERRAIAGVLEYCSRDQA